MSVVKDTNFIAIQGWMRTKLNLKGNELLIYALIYGFSQDENSRFKGSRKYIAEWCGCSLDTVDRSLSSLINKGLLAKYPHTDDHGNRLIDYVAIQSPAAATPAPAAAQTPAIAQTPAQDPWASTPNATPEQSQTPITEPKPQPQPKKTSKAKSFNDIIDAYTNDPKTKDLLGAWLQNRKAKRAAMTDRAIKGNINKLDRLAQESHMSVNEYLDEVVCRGWSGFFPIENYKSYGRSQQQQKPQQQNPWYDTPEAQRQYEQDTKEWEENCVFHF